MKRPLKTLLIIISIPIIIIALGYLAICIFFWFFADNYKESIYEEHIFSPYFEDINKETLVISEHSKRKGGQSKEVNILFQTDLEVNYLNSKYFNKTDCNDLRTRTFRILKGPNYKHYSDNMRKRIEEMPKKPKLTFEELTKDAECYKYYLIEDGYEMRSDFIYNPITKYYFYSYYEK